jgi:hypothetical protein
MKQYTKVGIGIFRLTFVGFPLAAETTGGRWMMSRQIAACEMLGGLSPLFLVLTPAWWQNGGRMSKEL